MEGILPLRLVSCLLASTLLGIGSAWPALVWPALSQVLGLGAQDRFRFWVTYQRRTSSITSLLLPLLTLTLSLSALLAESSLDAALPADTEPSMVLVHAIRSNRKSLFIVAAVFTLAHRTYSSTFIVPREEFLFEHDRKQLAKFTSTPLSPVDSEDSVFESESEKSPFMRPERIDTDAEIRDLNKVQLGIIFLSGCTFALTNLELLCV
ncbi:uncharacterized protein JCM15063_005068 [Sporobolomyces koalae]|uniref:uncharacterized protein n=1 Tax=Sporobolomyces koalae TaxID=500713 RepID=UPI00317228B4